MADGLQGGCALNKSLRWRLATPIGIARRYGRWCYLGVILAATVVFDFGCGNGADPMISAMSLGRDVFVEPDTGTPLDGSPTASLPPVHALEGDATPPEPDPGSPSTPEPAPDTIVTPRDSGDTLRFHVPWSPSETHRISQGNMGTFSHRGLFAWDIPMPEGTRVLASAAGIVVGVRLSSDVGLGLNESEEPENFVALDHGNGLKSVYSHLRHDGVAVSIGDYVAVGQVIGYSGNTGYSTSPHLHYEVRDVINRSVPSGFIESDRPDGVALLGDEITSQNEFVPESIEGLVPSTMARDAFVANGIELQNNVLPGFLIETDIDYDIRGRVLTDDSRVCAALVDPVSFATVFCELHPVDDDGAFTIPIRFTSDQIGPYWFGIISGNGSANGLAPARIHITAASDSLH